MIKYNIPAKITIERWIKVYNSHIDVDNINVFTEVCMNKTLKTTLQERIEIVEYCLEHGRNIKGTAELYGCTYGQLYSWVRKYEVLKKAEERERW